MYSTIMLPVDLQHTETLDKAIKVAADLVKLYQAELIFVGVTGNVPGSIASEYSEFVIALETFASSQAKHHGILIASKAIASLDVAAELDTILVDAAAEIQADLIVMASHIPGFAEYVFSSNAGYLANHSKLSVFVVR